MTRYRVRAFGYRDDIIVEARNQIEAKRLAHRKLVEAWDAAPKDRRGLRPRVASLEAENLDDRPFDLARWRMLNRQPWKVYNPQAYRPDDLPPKGGDPARLARLMADVEYGHEPVEEEVS